MDEQLPIQPTQIPTVPALDQKEKRPHHLLLLFLILVFPPGAFYILWKYKSYHSWFAPLIWSSGVVIFVYTMILNFFLMPYLAGALSSTGGSGAGFDTKWVYIISAVSLAQVVFGFYLKWVFKKQGEIPKLPMILCFFIFVFDYVIPGLIYNQIVTPLYSGLGL